MNNKENNDLYVIILKHYQLYPKMELIDYIKLLYQNEFGANHLLVNYQNMLVYINKELELWQNHQFSDNELQIIDIGNGYIRYPLGRIIQNKTSVEHIANSFYQTCIEEVGTKEGFENKLDYLLQLIKNKVVPLDYEKAINFINEYKKKNYPPVSHSETYRQNYFPSYRVIKKDFLKE